MRYSLNHILILKDFLIQMLNRRTFLKNVSFLHWNRDHSLRQYWFEWKRLPFLFEKSIQIPHVWGTEYLFCKYLTLIHELFAILKYHRNSSFLNVANKNNRFKETNVVFFVQNIFKNPIPNTHNPIAEYRP